MLSSLAGIFASVSEAVVRSRAERESGEDWETVCGKASQPETGERNLSTPGGRSAVSVRSRHWTRFFLLSQENQQQQEIKNVIFIGIVLLFFYLHKIMMFYLHCQNG